MPWLRTRESLPSQLKHLSASTELLMMKNQLVLSLLGLLVATAAARTSESHRQLLQQLHGDDVADISDYGEAHTPPSVYTRTSPDSGPHRFLNNKTESECAGPLELGLLCPWKGTCDLPVTKN